MNADLTLWQPPDKELVTKQDQYQATLEKSNDLAVTQLIAEKRDQLMRQQISTSQKFFDVINDHLDSGELDNLSKKDSRSALRSLAETLRIVSDVQAKASCFSTPKPREQDEQSGKLSLFVSVAPLPPQEMRNVTGT